MRQVSPIIYSKNLLISIPRNKMAPTHTAMVLKAIAACFMEIVCKCRRKAAKTSTDPSALSAAEARDTDDSSAEGSHATMTTAPSSDLTQATQKRTKTTPLVNVASITECYHKGHNLKSGSNGLRKFLTCQVCIHHATFKSIDAVPAELASLLTTVCGRPYKSSR